MFSPPIPGDLDRNPYPFSGEIPNRSCGGPVVATLTNATHRNVVGTHSGAYAVYRALAVASGSLQRDHRADLTNTTPTSSIGPHPSWADPKKIVSLDPFGATVSDTFADLAKQGFDIRPTIAITKAHINIPELQAAVDAGRLEADGCILKEQGGIGGHQGGNRTGVVPARDCRKIWCGGRGS